jgi:Tfp pilus assembly protein PilF
MVGHVWRESAIGQECGCQVASRASLGDATACQKALARAEEITQVAAGTSDPYWTGFDASRMASYKGACYLRLGQPAQALAALERSMALMTTPSPRQTPRILANMATAHVLQGEIEEACRLASEVLAMTHQTHNDMMVLRLRRFQKTLDRWQDTAAVRRFDEQFFLV